MAVTVQSLRTDIGDTGRPYPNPADAPANIGSGNGNQTLFALPDSGIDPNSLQVFFITQPAVGTLFLPAANLQDPSTYVLSLPPNPGGATITFNEPPPQGTYVSVRYNIVAFTDVELQTYIDRYTNANFVDDVSLSAACQYAIIGALISSPTRMATIHQERYSKNPSAVVKEMMALRKDLENTLEGNVIPGANVPAFSTCSGGWARFDAPYGPPT